MATGSNVRERGEEADDTILVRCLFCGINVPVNPWKKRKLCKCGAAWFCRRAGKSDYCEDGWRKDGKEYVYC